MTIEPPHSDKAIAPPSVLVIGDVMTDVVVRPEGPLVFGADRRASIRVLPGGSGANQAVWLASEKVRTSFAGRVGAADHAYQQALLAAAGVSPFLGSDASVPTGTVVNMVSENGERSFFTDRGANEKLCRSDLPDTLLDEIDLIHVSGYALFAAGPRIGVLEFLKQAKRRRIPFTVDPSSTSFLLEAGAENFLAWTEDATICLANAAEADVLAGTSDPDRQLQALTSRYRLVVIKRGAEGAIAADAHGNRWSAPAPALAVVDTTGAGDAFLAGFLSSFLRREPVEACLQRGVEMGSATVAKVGGRPPFVAASHAVGFP